MQALRLFPILQPSAGFHFFSSWRSIVFALRLGPSTFGIFDAFPSDSGRKAHLSGPIAAALMAKAGDLLAKPPQIDQVDVLAAKVPG